jgi:ClpP class serine protease
MSDIKKAAEKTEEITRKIWLAGLGAYGQSLDNLQQGYEKMNDQTRDFFEELVARGEKLESDTKSNVKSTREKIKEQADKNKELLSEQINELREKVSSNVSMPSFDKEELLEELQTRVNSLTETLSKLVKPAKKSAAKKAAPKKKAARKPAAKSPATGKPAAKRKAAPKKAAAKK